MTDKDENDFMDWLESIEFVKDDGTLKISLLENDDSIDYDNDRDE